MIFPILNGLLSFGRAPVTWSLIFLNVLFMTFSTLYGISHSDGFESLVGDRNFLEIQGAIYQSYLRSQSDHKIKREVASLVDKNSDQSLQVLGVLALRDQKFLESDQRDISFSDKVAFAYWKEKTNAFLKGRSFSVSQMLGVSSESFSLMSWVSYMFVHGSWAHLLSNMVFLLIVGCTLELSLGGLGVLIVYLLSGVAACGFFILTSGLSASPLVGASGAVSGLISAFAILNWQRPTRFFYWFLIPQRRAMGFVYLPGAFIFYLWLVSDLSGYLASSSFTGGIAHAAHLGGHLSGALAGLSLIVLRRLLRDEKEEFVGEPEMYQLHSLLPGESKA